MDVRVTRVSTSGGLDRRLTVAAVCGVFLLVGGCDEGPTEEEPCPGGDCELVCEAQDTWLALSAESAGDPNLVDLGDPDPASPEEVGDGQYHLFVGVKHDELDPWVVLAHDAIADDAAGPYSISSTPVIATLDEYDRYGIETPSYLRADAQTEYLYYCGLYRSYQEGARGQISALKRVGGGEWQKLGPVAPFGPGSTSQCEPDVVRDVATGRYYLFFIADGDNQGMLVRSSDDPELFAVESEILLSTAWFRPAIAYDPFSQVYRFVFDVNGYDAPPPEYLAQSWSAALPPDPAKLASNADLLHDPNHAFHLDLHLEGRGAIRQSGNAVYPDAAQVIFFYAGFGTAGQLRVNAQRCTRE